MLVPSDPLSPVWADWSGSGIPIDTYAKYRHRLRLRAVDQVVENLLHLEFHLKPWTSAELLPRRVDDGTAKILGAFQEIHQRDQTSALGAQWTKVPFLRKWIPTSMHHNK
ncbi:hypothetical protein BC829DRAFT_402573 [Chytridium lagenaria]|nr:hypothetical protein BC829DRAFT_402573 [Chytridium lagenaria]